MLKSVFYYVSCSFCHNHVVLNTFPVLTR